MHDCEINAAKRWLDANGARYHTGQTLLGDDLYSRQPFCRKVLQNNYRFIFACKPTSHPYARLVPISRATIGSVFDEANTSIPQSASSHTRETLSSPNRSATPIIRIAGTTNA